MQVGVLVEWIGKLLLETLPAQTSIGFHKSIMPAIVD